MCLGDLTIRSVIFNKDALCLLSLNFNVSWCYDVMMLIVIQMTVFHACTLLNLNPHCWLVNLSAICSNTAFLNLYSLLHSGIEYNMKQNLIFIMYKHFYFLKVLFCFIFHFQINPYNVKDVSINDQSKLEVPDSKFSTKVSLHFLLSFPSTSPQKEPTLCTLNLKYIHYVDDFSRFVIRVHVYVQSL